MKTAIFQPPYPRHGEAPDTLKWILEHLRGLPIGSADLVILPEYSNCLGAEGRDEILTAIRGTGKDLEDECRKTAERLHAIVMAGIVVEDDSSHLHNVLMVFEPGKATYSPYSKNYPVEVEFQEGFVQGTGPGVFEINGIRYGVAICFDFYFPELFAKYADARIDVMIVPSLQRSESADRILYLSRARAFDCGCTLLRSSVAMPGRDDVAGHSMVIGPDGIIHADANCIPCILMADFEPKARFVRQASYDRPGQITDYRETRLAIKQKVTVCPPETQYKHL